MFTRSCSVVYLFVLLFQVSNVDDVLKYHSELLNNSLKDCMLTNPELLDLVHKLLVLCIKFVNFLEVDTILFNFT